MPRNTFRSALDSASVLDTSQVSSSIFSEVAKSGFLQIDNSGRQPCCNALPHACGMHLQQGHRMVFEVYVLPAD